MKHQIELNCAWRTEYGSGESSRKGLCPVEVRASARALRSAGHSRGA